MTLGMRHKQEITPTQPIQNKEQLITTIEPVDSSYINDTFFELLPLILPNLLLTWREREQDLLTVTI